MRNVEKLKLNPPHEPYIHCPDKYNPPYFEQELALKDIDDVSGIYVIRNGISQRFYVGQSMNLKERLLKHWRDLCNNSHSNHLLQKDFWDNGWFGIDFEILQECSPKWLDYYEAIWANEMGALNPQHGYNQTTLPDMRGVSQEEITEKIHWLAGWVHGKWPDQLTDKGEIKVWRAALISSLNMDNSTFNMVTNVGKRVLEEKYNLLINKCDPQLIKFYRADYMQREVDKATQSVSL